MLRINDEKVLGYSPPSPLSLYNDDNKTTTITNCSFFSDNISFPQKYNNNDNKNYHEWKKNVE
ncbi:hypothetical protein DERP_003797 [Dermatophagoides pteronyssinus]|uniref:Uncharacterized protein n=1 Tax=Dermatophagoides pteronyssinus TaxID=6956 RepID=A0ABQ8JLM8_DERPT|nr:hypothetical protein DERP_003797 [Dermatophagoides pteronyssinus]